MIKVHYYNGDEVVYADISFDSKVGIYEAKTFFAGTKTIPAEVISYIEEVS